MFEMDVTITRAHLQNALMIAADIRAMAPRISFSITPRASVKPFPVPIGFDRKTLTHNRPGRLAAYPNAMEQDYQPYHAAKSGT